VTEFEGLHCRACRPAGLNAAEINAVIGFAMARLGYRYDLKNVVDLARFPPRPYRCAGAAQSIFRGHE